MSVLNLNYSYDEGKKVNYSLKWLRMIGVPSTLTMDRHYYNAQIIFIWIKLQGAFLSSTIIGHVKTVHCDWWQ